MSGGKRVFLGTTGCRLNQSEVETIARQFRQTGHEIVASAEEADLCVVNTCAVTRDASRSSRNLICRLNRTNPQSEIVGNWVLCSPVTRRGRRATGRFARDQQQR